LSEKQSLSQFLDNCTDKTTENEVEQEKLNTGPTTTYQTYVIIQGGRNRKKLDLHWSRHERETVV
jgi:hypothetical protein